MHILGVLLYNVLVLLLLCFALIHARDLFEPRFQHFPVAGGKDVSSL